ncbi:glucose-6-phosphate exchanger SLC37A2 [Condylostylus longicornis]|uniref:glucose-6-phosphate exchanger SLC37A2 n=1 Tax=Condylostylus longicornis TaxID=2530218 RepID=UPI00244DC9BE|nr:glucose-6-phosphate exchanger SLC37A2 [Condylostylus longicornis]
MRISVNNYKKMSINYNDIPVGILAIQKFSGVCCSRIRFRRELLFKSSVLFLTYLSYTCYHMTRKPISVVKTVLQGNCSNITPSTINVTCDGYPPFDDLNAASLFGYLDSAFLFSYAAAMFASGFLAERCSLRYFLSSGMILTAIFTYLFGIAKTLNIHDIWYFIFVQVAAGIFQTTGWPGVVTVVGRWFGKSKRGLIFGIWNSHTSIGNILGTFIAAKYVTKDWSLSFIVPGLIMGIVGFILFLFLVDSPELVSCNTQDVRTGRRLSTDSDVDVENGDSSVIPQPEITYRPTERTHLLRRQSSTNSVNHSNNAVPIDVLSALKIPGVIEFSLCLFFSKLVSYTFLYWLPLYIQSSTTLPAEESAHISTVFDIGGIVGAIAAGMIADATSMPAITCAGMFFLAVPILALYHSFGAESLSFAILLLFLAGILVNGPYSLITTSVSAELGQHSSLEGNAKAIATVTAIIDGTGSIGAAIGPLLTGVISGFGWQNVFHMLIASDILAMIFLNRLVYKEFVTHRLPARIE